MSDETASDPAGGGPDTTFDLRADPAALRAAAGSVRSLGQGARDAGTIIKEAADQIEAEEAWLGDTASRYQQHRRGLTGDLESLGHEAIGAADVLDEIADLLTYFQAALDEVRATVDGIPSTVLDIPGVPGDPVVVYRPRDETETEAVNDARQQARDLRAALDEALAAKEGSLRRLVEGTHVASMPYASTPGLRLLAQTWRARTLRHLNLNIGEGDPTDHRDMDEIAGIINSQGANVVTLQEVFKEDLDDLTEHLDGEWAVYFANADNKFRGPSPENWSEDFGNVVLVRQGDGIESQGIEEDNRVKLDAPGSMIPDDLDLAASASVPPADVPDDTYRADGEGRAAAVAQITIRP
jgi:hypothetical protein